MRKTEFQNRLSSVSTEARREKLSTFDEAGMLFEQIAGEARRQAETEREADRRRGPLLKFLLALVFLSVLSAAAVGIYGIYIFPDAPIREKAGNYAGKYGKPYSKEDFERFTLWKYALFVSFGVTFTLGFASAVLESRLRRKHNVPG